MWGGVEALVGTFDGMKEVHVYLRYRGFFGAISMMPDRHVWGVD